MTVQQIFVEVTAQKPMSLPTLYKHMHALRIKPLGVRQRPQIYPADTPEKILQRLGLTNIRRGKAVAR